MFIKKSKPDEGEFGYLKYQKKANILITLFFFALSFSVLVSAYILSGHTRNNVGTVFAAVMVLPACKSLTGLVILLPHKSASKNLYERINAMNTQTCVLYDMLMTSEEKSMYADAIAIDEEKVVMFVNEKGQDTGYIKKYFSKVSGAYELGVEIDVCTDEDDFISTVKSMGPVNENVENIAQTIKYFGF